jgi:ribokinase
VVSLGSVNVDRIVTVAAADVERFAERYGWFPGRGRTVRVPSLPEGFDVEADEVRHGGKGANQAVAAAAGGAETTMLGAVGPDDERLGVRDALTDAGVDADRVATAADPTGTAYVFVGESGTNRIVVVPGANAAVDETYVRANVDVVRAADCLLLQNEIPAAPVTWLLDDLAGDPDRPTVLLDPAPVEGVERLVAHDVVDYLTPNEHEYAALGAARDAFEGTLIRKRGDDAVIVEDGDRFAVDPPAVQVADTTGAGDVLNGVLAARLAAGESLRAAVSLAAVAGSLSTRSTGARTDVPTLAEARAFRAAVGPRTRTR